MYFNFDLDLISNQTLPPKHYPQLRTRVGNELKYSVNSEFPNLHFPNPAVPLLTEPWGQPVFLGITLGRSQGSGLRHAADSPA